MASKKHFFTKNNERVGKKSGKPRGKYKKHSVQAQEEKAIEVIELSNVSVKQKSPNIYRSITEKVLFTEKSSWKVAGLVGFFSIVLILSTWQAIAAVEKSLLLKQVVTKRLLIAQDEALWKSIAARYPGYRDAYFRVAVLAYQVGDLATEKNYLQKTLQIDPNYLPALQMEKQH